MAENPDQERGGHPSSEEGIMGAWSLDLEMTGDDPESIIQALDEFILSMMQGGVYHAAALSETTGVTVHYNLRRVVERGLYIDGEGTLVAVDDDGEVVGLVSPDGKEDETAGVLQLDALEWARQHGGLVDARQSGRKPTAEQIDHMTQKTIGNLSNLIKGWLDKEEK